MLLMLAAVAVSNQSCKAWRTIATSATYVQQNDSAKAQTTTTISTKTTEEYVGTRRKQGSPTDGLHPVGRAELLRVFTTKT